MGIATRDSTSPIVAIVGTKAIRKDELWPFLIEIGGEDIIREYALTLSLEQKLEEEGVRVTRRDIQNEESLYLSLQSNLEDDALNSLFEQKGYGQLRKTKLLWRNAALRKLVQNEVVIDGDAVYRMYSIVHGEKIPARIIVVSSLAEARRAKERISQGEPFVDVAIDVSIDLSAPRGGKLDPIAITDPSWPAPIREALSNLELHEVTDPILLSDRWCILTSTGPHLLSSIEFDDVEAEMTSLTRLTQERFLMESLAATLLDQLEIKYFDMDLIQSSSSNAHGSQ